MNSGSKSSLPSELVTHVTAICGDEGEAWLAGLPRTINELEELWSISVEEPFSGAEFNFVAPARRSDVDAVVIKIAPPFKNTEIFSEAKYLRSRQGRGAVRLIEENRERLAMLIERAVPGIALFQQFKDDPAGCIEPAIRVLGDILQKPPSDMCDLQLLDRWFENFRRYKDTSFPAKLAEKAFEIYKRSSGESGRTFYLHGDFHPGNIVTSNRAPFLAIDPKGLVGHIGYDIAVLLNNLLWWQKGSGDVESLLQNAIAKFSEAFGLGEKELREWAFAYMVIGAWWNFEEMPEHYEGDAAFSEVWGV